MLKIEWVANWRFATALCITLLIGNAFAGPAGTTLTYTGTATPTVIQTNTYSWSVTKALPPNQVPFVIPQGQSANVPFIIQATQTGPTVTTDSAVSGQLCVNNTGSVATDGFSLTAQLESSPDGTTWTTIDGPIALPITSEIPAGGQECFNYDFSNVNLNPILKFRTHSTVTLYNYQGWEGTGYSINFYTSTFTVTVITTNVDATATLGDAFQCPTGFTCTVQPFTTNLTGTTTINYSVQITNNSAVCNQTLTPLNTATLTQNTTQMQQTAHASATVSTGACPSTPCASGTAFTNSGSMEGNLAIAPGDTLWAGYDFTIPGANPAIAVYFLGGNVTVQVTCPNNSTVNLVIPLPSQNYFVPAGNSDWFPTQDQSSPLGYQGSITVPAGTCGGATGHAPNGATITGSFASVPNAGLHVRFHYLDSPTVTGASWSSTQTVNAVCTNTRRPWE